VTVVTHHNVSVPTDGSGLLLGRSGVKNYTEIKRIGPSGRLGIRNDANTYCIKTLSFIIPCVSRRETHNPPHYTTP